MYPFSFHKNIKQHNFCDHNNVDEDDDDNTFLLLILIMRNTEDWSNNWWIFSFAITRINNILKRNI